MRYSEEEKTMWLEDWKQSGKSAWSYAKENGLNLQTFVKWTKSSQAENKDCFIEVPVHVIPPHQHNREILIEKGDVKIHIPLYLESGELRAVMECLGRAL